VANQRLWAPWRLNYIKGEKTDECIFCAKPALGDDAKALIPFRGERCYVILNAFPYNNGHLMVAPYEHTAQLEDLDEDAASELMSLARRAIRALSGAYGPDGYNIGINLGSAAGAGMADHLHLHVVPRWAGDTNFMPIVGDTRVLPEALQDSYANVREAFGALDAE
jgi:ATP adenylyltransferase